MAEADLIASTSPPATMVDARLQGRERQVKQAVLPGFPATKPPRFNWQRSDKGNGSIGFSTTWGINGRKLPTYSTRPWLRALQDIGVRVEETGRGKSELGFYSIYEVQGLLQWPVQLFVSNSV